MDFRKTHKLNYDELDFLSEVAWNRYMTNCYLIYKANKDNRYFIVNDLTMEVVLDTNYKTVVSNWFEKLKD